MGYLTITCLLCNKERWTYHQKSKPLPKFCGLKCAGISRRNPNLSWPRKKRSKKMIQATKKKRSEKMTGDKNPNWKGGTRMMQGYRYILMPEHPLALNRGYVKEQALVAETYLGRLLSKEEIVHHINKIKDDNRPENLYVFSCVGEHTAHHARLRSGKEQPKVSNLIPPEEGEE